jgi:hypothetical protein
MPKYRVLSLKPHLRLDWRGQDSQDETQKPDHSASLSESVTSSTRMSFSVHTGSIKSFPILGGLHHHYARSVHTRLRAEGIVSKKVDGTYQSGPCRVWIKVRNPAGIAVQRERSEMWNR